MDDYLKTSIKKPTLVDYSKFGNVTINQINKINKINKLNTKLKKNQITFYLNVSILIIFLLFFIYFLLNCRSGAFKNIYNDPEPYYTTNKYLESFEII